MEVSGQLHDPTSFNLWGKQSLILALWKGDKIKDENGGACSMHGRYKKLR
jgi:hypothetical protein